jgi:hypothetical protein
MADVCTHILLDDFALHAAGGPIKKPDPLKLLEAVSVFKGAGLKILLQVGANKFTTSKGRARNLRNSLRAGRWKPFKGSVRNENAGNCKKKTEPITVFTSIGYTQDASA